MDVDSNEIRDRLQVMHIDDSISTGEGAVWHAEDPKTGCTGLGDVEAEAIGNAISVVIQYEYDTPNGAPYVKVPGQVVEKTWTSDRTGLFESLRELL